MRGSREEAESVNTEELSSGIDFCWSKSFAAIVQDLRMADIWERKIRTHFHRKDLDKDGVISRKDFVAMAERFADKVKFTAEQKEAAKKCLDHIFTRYVRASGKHDDKLTEDLLVESLRTQKDDPGFKKCLSDFVHSILVPLDVNQDGYLDADEYRRLFENCGLVETEFTKAAFDLIDTDKDGKLSFEEFENALIAYMCSDDPNTIEMFGLDSLEL